MDRFVDDCDQRIVLSSAENYAIPDNWMFSHWEWGKPVFDIYTSQKWIIYGKIFKILNGIQLLNWEIAFFYFLFGCVNGNSRSYIRGGIYFADWFSTKNRIWAKLFLLKKIYKIVLAIENSHHLIKIFFTNFYFKPLANILKLIFLNSLCYPY